MLLTLQETFDVCLKNKHTIVLGNLGRKNQLVARQIAMHPNLEVMVVSPYYAFPESDRVHVNGPVQKCDLLIYIEPKNPVKVVDYASRIIVFTSNLAFPESKEFLTITYYHSDDIEVEIKTARKLLDLQMVPVSHRNVNVVKNQIGFVEVKTLSNRSDSDYVYAHDKPVPEFFERTYVIVDLTKCTEILEMFLCVLDAFDVLKRNAERVERWVVCFPEGTERRFRDFEQRLIDDVTCSKHDKEKTTVLKTTPFAKDHRPPNPMEKSKTLSSFFFFGNEILVPQDLEGACWANLENDVFSVQNRIYIKN
jgi:hypothetical protein